MSSALDHHARAEQLLDQAHAEQDSIRRGLILAEAQVHATLALSAPADKGPPGPGQAQTGSAASTGETRPAFPMRPGVPPGATTHPTWRDDLARTGPPEVTGRRRPTANPPVRVQAEPRGDAVCSPSAEDTYPGRRRQKNQRPEQEPGPAQQQEPDPGEQESGPAGQSPAAGSPGDQKPGSFRPF